MTSTETLLAALRKRITIWQESPDPEAAREAADDAVMIFAELDAHLTAGGTPPEAWREGPDAPADAGPWGWQGDPVADDPDRDDVTEERPAPEGFAVFAHWSAVHSGVNVEIDAPEGLPLTVHVNDWRAVNVVIGTNDPADADPALLEG